MTVSALTPAGVGRSADLLSHEATFTADMYAKARIAQHSTAPMAGNFARQLGAQTLVLTHFSGRFTEFRGKVRLCINLCGSSARKYNTHGVVAQAALQLEHDHHC